MLIEFQVTNFKSFKEKQALSMIASSDKSLLGNTTVVEELGNRRLVRSAVVYGANASGKSNLMDAFRFVRFFVAKSIEEKPDRGVSVRPFLLDTGSAQAPSSFEMSFVCKGMRCQYGFSVDSSRVHEEWLITYPKGKAQTWFERPVDGYDDPDNWYFGPGLRGEKKRLVHMLRSNVLFLPLAAKFAHQQLTDIYEWFASNLRVVKMSEFPEIQRMEQFTASRMSQVEPVRTAVKGFVELADLGIFDVSVEKTRPFAEAGLPPDIFTEKGRSMLAEQEVFDVKMRHRAQDSDSGVYLPLEDESCGTRRFFALSGPWLYALSSGHVLVVDEIDSSLHPHLVRALVELFHNPEVNDSGAQLIFNTHDVTQLDNTLFRRDQIWFVEKDSAGASHLYPLLEYKPRKGEALEKGYLQGRYGAIPFIGISEGLDFHVEE